jgi:hypothetical protein
LSRLRRSGSARMFISTTFPPAIVKPITANTRPSGRRDTNPGCPLTRKIGPRRQILVIRSEEIA